MSYVQKFAVCRSCRCLSARREAQRLTRAFDDRLRPFGLTINQFSMLTTLILAGPLAISDLAERLGVDRTTMTRNVAVSERSGLIETSGGEDRRVRLVTITAAGREIADAALPAWQEAQSAE